MWEAWVPQMNKYVIAKVLLVLLFQLLLVACQNNRSSVIDEEFLDWSDRCLPGLYERAAELAGDQHHNCGYFSSFGHDLSEKEFYQSFSNGLTCVDEAYKNQQAFVYGIFAIWKDTYICEVFIQDQALRLYRIFIDLDPSGGADRSGQHAWYVEEGCESVRIDEKIRAHHYLNHVSTSGCEALSTQE